MLHTTPSPSACRILIVDDEASIRKLIQQKLMRRDFRCKTASCAREAYQLLAEETFDAVVSDLRMPGETGLELAAKVCANYPYVPVLLFTGVEDVRTAVESIQSGVSDYLLKPLETDQLIFSIRRAIETSRMKRELDEYRTRLEAMVEERTTQLREAFLEIQRTHAATLEALGTALDYRDTETQGHSRRVTAMCRALATAIGVTPEVLCTITYGAYLHDVGKIAIPDTILRKPGKLTPEEQQVMRTHVEIGFRMVNSIPMLRPAAEIILTHHEAFDGSGYPRGLKFSDIPLGSRIFAIADTVDAITSDRPYRKGRPFAAAREEILRCSGTQFDPAIVAVFLELPEATFARTVDVFADLGSHGTQGLA